MLLISTKYSASPRKCVWRPLINHDGAVFENTTDTQCSDMVASSMNNIGFKRALFMGDSTMHNLWMWSRQVLWKKTDELFSDEFAYKIHHANRCKWYKILGIKQEKVSFSPTLESPKISNPAAWCNSKINITNIIGYKSTPYNPQAEGTWLPDGYSRIFRIVCVWPFGLLDFGSATLRCKI